MIDLINGIRSIVETCMEIRPEERILVIADTDPGPMWVGQVFMNVFSSIGADAVLSLMTPRQSNAQEPPATVAAAMKSATTIVCISDRFVLTHTDARKEATAAGARYYNMRQIPIDDLKKGVSAADIHLLQERTEGIAQRLTQAKTARITTPAGTDITMSLAGREGVALHPLGVLRHLVGGIPDYAEAAVAPVEGTAEGIVVIDLAYIDWGYLLGEPLRCTVKGGKLVDIAGRPEEADRLRKVAARDENASNIAELGIGTSHIIPGPLRGTRRDAGRIGTAHIAIGRNNSIGGATWSRVHTDGLMSRVTIELDGECVLREGVLLV